MGKRTLCSWRYAVLLRDHTLFNRADDGLRRDLFLLHNPKDELRTSLASVLFQFCVAFSSQEVCVWVLGSRSKHGVRLPLPTSSLEVLRHPSWLERPPCVFG